MYSEAVRRLSVSIMLGWRTGVQLEHYSHDIDGLQLMFREAGPTWYGMAHNRWLICDLFGLVAMWGKVNKYAKLDD